MEPQAEAGSSVLKGCSECPYKVKSKHNEKFLESVKKMAQHGFIDGRHRCHMRVKDKKFWDRPTSEDECVNSQKID